MRLSARALRLAPLVVLATMAFASQAHAASFTLQKVEVDKAHVQGGESNGWTIPDAGGQVVWKPPFGEATYTFPLPQTIPSGGATFTLSLDVTASPSSRFAPAFGVSGFIVKDGPVTVGAVAEPGQHASDSKQVTLAPPTVTGTKTPTTVSVGIQDGPTYTYTYVPVPDEPATPTAFGKNGVISAPSNRKCVSRRNFRIRLRKPPKGLSIEQGIVFVNGNKVATRKGKRVTAPVDLRGLPKGRFTVKITVILSNGDVIAGKRRYKTCTPKKRKARAITTVADVTVPGDGSPQETGSLKSGVTTIRVTDSISETFEACDSLHTVCHGNRTVGQDALYCFEHSGYSDPNSPENCSTSSPGPGLTNWLQFQIGHSGPKYTLYGLAGQPDDPYHGDHAYRVTFNAGFSDNSVTVSGSPGITDTSSSGGIHVEFIQDSVEPEPPTGDLCGATPGRRAFTAKICDVTATSLFGTDLQLPAPAVGLGVVTTTPSIPTKTKSLVADAHLDGAAPGPVAGVMPIVNKKLTDADIDTVGMCVFYAAAGLKEKNPNVEISVEQSQRLALRVFVICAQLLDPSLLKDRATAGAAGCRARFVAVALPGKHPSARTLKRAQKRTTAALRGSCASDSAGDLTFALTSRKRNQGVRELVGRRATTGFVRTTAPRGSDGPSPKLVLNWSRIRR